MVTNKKIHTTSTKCQYQAAASKPKCWSFVLEYFVNVFSIPVVSCTAVNSCCEFLKVKICFKKVLKCRLLLKKREAVIIPRKRQYKRKIVPMVTCKPWNPVVTKKVEP